MSLIAAICAATLSAAAPSTTASPAVSPIMATATVQATARLNAPYNAFLSKYVTTEDGVNVVNYGRVTAADKAALKRYVAELQRLRPSTMSRNEELAFWFNLYNAKTIELILDNYPVESIRQIGGGLIARGPWKMDVVTVEGERLSLDNIEHDTVREKFDEPRVHYAFNCASIGCPNLKTSAWEASSLDRDLDAAARAFINHPRGVEVKSNGRVVASSIYTWFKRDFGRNDEAVLSHIRQYADGNKAEALSGIRKINGYQYDWSLNSPQ